MVSQAFPPAALDASDATCAVVLMFCCTCGGVVPVGQQRVDTQTVVKRDVPQSLKQKNVEVDLDGRYVWKKVKLWYTYNLSTLQFTNLENLEMLWIWLDKTLGKREKKQSPNDGFHGDLPW